MAEGIIDKLAYSVGYASIIGFVTLMQAGPATITQHRINELAGKCFNAQYAMSGLKGAKKPGETQEQYSARIKSYLAALDDTDRALQPIKQSPALVHITLENEKTWKDISLNVGKLDHDVIEAHSAWAANSKEGEKAKLGPKLLQALTTVQLILAGLRDAKP